MRQGIKRWAAAGMSVLILVGLLPAMPVQAAEAAEEIYTTHQGNPYLPLWEYIPDGEPYVFEDPDNPGQYRAYIYGSHDMLKTAYCGKDLVVWSAPVDDLTQWRYDGVIFQSPNNGGTDYDVLYAPDIALVEEKDGSKTYYLYPNNQNHGNSRSTMVAKSDRPDGPFEVCNWTDDSHISTTGVLGFDPAVHVDDDGRVYGYWGFQDSYWGELDPDNMASLKTGTSSHKNIPSWDQMMAADYNPADYNIYQDENTQKWGFFEASSIRKVGNKYVFIYSRNGLSTEPTGKNYNQLAYGYSDSPAGPWKYGGIIVDAAGETIPNGWGGYDRTFAGGNTHGSICEIDGQWYIFYHRNLHTYARQSMVDPITVEWDEKSVAEGGEVRISMAEVTSNGFFLDGLDPYREHSAAIVSYLTGGASIGTAYTQDTTTLPINNIKNNVVAGIKYFNFDQEVAAGQSTALQLDVVPKGVDAQIDVYLRPTTAVNTPVTSENGVINSVGTGSYKIGTVELTADMPQELTTMQIPVPAVDDVDGQWGVFFVFRGGNGAEICQFYNMEFVGVENYFDEDFNGDLSGWETTGDAAIQDGSLVLTGDATATMKPGAEYWSDYAVTAEIASLNGTVNLRFRQTDENNYYQLSVTDSKLELSAVVYGEKHVLGEAACAVGDGPFTLTVDANGDAIGVKIDGTLYLSVQDDSHNIGMAGFATTGSDSAAIGSVKVDNSLFQYVDMGDDAADTYTIEMDGQSLTGFDPAVSDYLVAVEDGASIPVITAACSDPAVTVSVAQAADVPGSAFVRYGMENGTVRQYQIKFYVSNGASQDLGNLSALPDALTYVKAQDAITLEEQGIALKTTNSSDQDFPKGNYPTIGLKEPLTGDWQVEVKMSADQELNFGGYGAYGLGLYADDGNYLKFVVQARDNNGQNFQGLELAGTNIAGVYPAHSGTTTWLRLAKAGSTLTASVSSDGMDYQQINQVNLTDAFASAQLQIFATKLWSATDFTAYAEEVSVIRMGGNATVSDDQKAVEAAAAKVGSYILLPKGTATENVLSVARQVLTDKNLGVDWTLEAVNDGYQLTMTQGTAKLVLPSIELVVETANFADLTEKIAEAKALNEADYTFATWNKLESALAKAEACTAQTDALEIMAAYDRLSLAIAKLEEGDSGEPGEPVEISTDAAIRMTEDQDAAGRTIFNFNLKNAKNVAAVEIHFTANSDDVEITPQGGFSYLDPDQAIETVRLADGTAEYMAVLCYLQEGLSFSCTGEQTVAKIAVAGDDPTIQITAVKIAGLDADGNETDGEIGAIDPDTAPEPKPETSYDVTGDGKVDLLDVVYAKRYYRSSASSSTEAARCDFDGSGTVDLQDLIAVVLHYTAV